MLKCINCDKELNPDTTAAFVDFESTDSFHCKAYIPYEHCKHVNILSYGVPVVYHSYQGF